MNLISFTNVNICQVEKAVVHNSQEASQNNQSRMRAAYQTLTQIVQLYEVTPKKLKQLAPSASQRDAVEAGLL